MHEPARPLIIGHRGASGYRPEHTAAAYELAFALGAEAVEPDIVATRDGVLVVRHENEISTTTDIASHPEFADRRTTKVIDGQELTGWFTEDFTWAELATLRAIERLPSLRQPSSSFDGMYPILRLCELLAIVDRISSEAARPLGVVAELKHATYFESIGLPLDELFAAELRRTGWLARPELVVESFERAVLGKLRGRGFPGRRIYLIEAKGAPADRVSSLGDAAAPYAEDLTDEGLAALAHAGAADRVEGISVHLSLLPSSATGGREAPTEDLVERAHAAGLSVYCWTLRPENRFLPKRLRRGSDPASYGDWLRRFAGVVSAGVDGVFTDQPDLAVVARGRVADFVAAAEEN
jgi:glycerophosphoryl diester phosphodiesterase